VRFIAPSPILLAQQAESPRLRRVIRSLSSKAPTGPSQTLPGEILQILQQFRTDGQRYVSTTEQTRVKTAVCVTAHQSRVIRLSPIGKTHHVSYQLKRGIRRVTVMPAMSQNTKTELSRYLPLLIIAALAAVGTLVLGDLVSFETLRDNRDALLSFRDANFGAMVLSFVAAYVVIVSFSLPGALVATLTGGFLFGTVLGSLLSVTGATMGATVIFLAARLGLGETLKARMDASTGTIGKFKRGIDENQWSMLFFIRLVPVVPFFVANLVPAFLAVPLHRFVVSTFLGIIPGSLVYASVGAGLGEVFARGESPDLGLIFEPHILLPIVGLSLLSLLPVLIKAVTGKKDL
jgi:uncharacterized membrane protein YdjX (TVP38/TMEM64 family)